MSNRDHANVRNLYRRLRDTEEGRALIGKRAVARERLDAIESQLDELVERFQAEAASPPTPIDDGAEVNPNGVDWSRLLEALLAPEPREPPGLNPASRQAWADLLPYEWAVKEACRLETAQLRERVRDAIDGRLSL